MICVCQMRCDPCTHVGHVRGCAQSIELSVPGAAAQLCCLSVHESCTKERRDPEDRHYRNVPRHRDVHSPRGQVFCAFIHCHGACKALHSRHHSTSSMLGLQWKLFQILGLLLVHGPIRITLACRVQGRISISVRPLAPMISVSKHLCEPTRLSLGPGLGSMTVPCGGNTIAFSLVASRKRPYETSLSHECALLGWAERAVATCE